MRQAPSPSGVWRVVRGWARCNGTALVGDELAGTLSIATASAASTGTVAGLPQIRRDVQTRRRLARQSHGPVGSTMTDGIDDTDAADTALLGMSEDELYGYLTDLLREEAAEAAEQEGTSATEELASPGFAAAEAASTYAIKLILANNAFLTRQLLDLGVLQPGTPDAAG